MLQLYLFGQIVDFIGVFTFFCENFDDYPIISLCHVHDLLEVDLFFMVPSAGERLHRPAALSRI